MMFRDRDELLRKLHSDYLNHKSDPENSFICRYLKNMKEIKAENLAADKDELLSSSTGTSYDKYIILRAAFQAMKNGVISFDEYSGIYRNISQKYAKKRSKKKTNADPNEGRKDLEDYLFNSAVNNFFDNAGFKKGFDDPLKNAVQNPDGIERNPKKVKKPFAGYIDYVELAFSFSEEFPPSDSTAAGTEKTAPAALVAITPEYTQKCIKLFEQAKKSGSRDLLIPLYYDPQTGAGVIIAGSKVIPVYDEKQPNCSLYIVWFSDNGAAFGSPSEHYSPMIDFEMNTQRCSGVSEAFSVLKKGLGGCEYYDGYAEINDLGGQAVDPVFAKLFDGTSERDLMIMGYENKEEEKEFED